MRCSGILMHITSLPGPYGVGTMGKQAFSFIDFLHDAGQSCWQILPLNPTGYGDSPYQSCSTFTGNHYLIDLETLVEEGLLEKQELENIPWCCREDKVDYGSLYNHRMAVLRKAYRRHGETEEFARFRACNDHWLPDFLAYMGLKDKFGGKPWYEWPEQQRVYTPSVIDDAWEYMGYDNIQFYCFVQYLFYKQWNRLHDYARSKGIRIIGDVPIYVPYDSVEVWRQPQLFQLDENLNPRAVAGCPPDGFTADGQLWGNPLYDWDAMEKDGFDWWIRRLEAAGELYDVVRLDHFRGLESYWSIPYGDSTARNGKWVKGPGMKFINAVKTALPELRMIAEDLGYLTPEVLQLRDASGFPGMKILEFAFDVKEPANYLPYTYTHNSVVYTGTHDNLTMQQWFDTADEESRNYAIEYMNLTEREGFVWGTIRTAFSTVSDTCIIPVQDLLALGGEARMNFPGTLSDSNWTWRMKDGTMEQLPAEKLLALTRLYGRTER